MQQQQQQQQQTNIWQLPVIKFERVFTSSPICKEACATKLLLSRFSSQASAGCACANSLPATLVLECWKLSARKCS